MNSLKTRGNNRAIRSRQEIRKTNDGIRDVQGLRKEEIKNSIEKWILLNRIMNLRQNLKRIKGISKSFLRLISISSLSSKLIRMRIRSFVHNLQFCSILGWAETKTFMTCGIITKIYSSLSRTNNWEIWWVRLICISKYWYKLSW